MRSLTSLGVSLAAAVALAGMMPTVHAGGPKLLQKRHTARHLCPDCQMRDALARSGGAPVVIEGPDMGSMPMVSAPGGCASCAASGAVIGGPVYMAADGAPGVATLSGEAPGVASLNGPTGNEPMPIGVVQASYSQGSKAPAAGGGYSGRAGSFDPTHGDPRVSHALGTPMPGRNGAAISGLPGAAGAGGPVQFAPDGRSRRPRILSTLVGFEGFGSIRRARAERAAQAHAMIPMGDVSRAPVTSLPASSVYGR